MKISQISHIILSIIYPFEEQVDINKLSSFIKDIKNQKIPTKHNDKISLQISFINIIYKCDFDMSDSFDIKKPFLFYFQSCFMILCHEF